MKAITLYQPWAGLVIYGQKRVENRGWKPSLAVGDRLAIHAGMRNVGVEESVERLICSMPPLHMKNAFMNGVILGDCRFMGIIRDSQELPEDQRRWFTGPLGWRLEDVRRLPSPLKMKGSQGLWNLPVEAVEALEKSGIRT